MAGIWLIGGMGAFGVIFAFIVGLMPTGDFSSSEAVSYVAGVLLGTFLLAVPPLIFLKMKKPGWIETSIKEG
jgi:hypothetical protein